MVKASHIFPWKHGQATMDAIFGETRQSDTFSEGNGLLMHTRLEEAFDKDVFVIILDLPNEPMEARQGPRVPGQNPGPRMEQTE